MRSNLASSFSLIGGNNLVSLWYSPPPFRMHHSAKRTVELEWEKESSSSFQEPFKLAITYQPTGSYFIKVQKMSVNEDELGLTFVECLIFHCIKLCLFSTNLVVVLH